MLDNKPEVLQRIEMIASEVETILGLAEVDRLFHRLGASFAWHDSQCGLFKGQSHCSCDQDLVSARKGLIEILRKLKAGPPPFSCLDKNIEPLFPEKLLHRGGRPTKYTRKLAVRIGLLQLVGGFYLSDALRIVGVSRWSAWRWSRKYPVFGEMIGMIRQCRRRWPERFRGPVLHPRKRRLFGTRPWEIHRGRPSSYRTEFAQLAKAGTRSTAKAIGVSPSTVHRWSKEYYREFGAKIDLARFKGTVARLQGTAAMMGWSQQRTARHEVPAEVANNGQMPARHIGAPRVERG